MTSRLQTFETERLAEEENFAGLARINRELIGKVEAPYAAHRVVLDMDSTEIPVYGEQENNAYNGHFESTCYHPLLLFTRDGDCLAAKLRPGSVHTARTMTTGTSSHLKALLEKLKMAELVLDWRKQQKTRAMVFTTIQEILDQLSKAYTKELYNQKCDVVYQHFYESYMGQGKSVYAVN